MILTMFACVKYYYLTMSLLLPRAHGVAGSCHLHLKLKRAGTTNNTGACPDCPNSYTPSLYFSFVRVLSLFPVLTQKSCHCCKTTTLPTFTLQFELALNYTTSITDGGVKLHGAFTVVGLNKAPLA